MSDWITHNGGPCPVAEDTLVDVEHRDGDIYIGENAIRGYCAREWNHTGGGGDTIAYRLHKPAPQHPPINVEAEFSADGGKWRRGRIRYRSDRHTVVEFAHTEKAYGPSVDLRSRDIPSVEDKAVEAMIDAYEVVSPSAIHHSIREVYRAIAAGRIPGVRLEDDDA